MFEFKRDSISICNYQNSVPYTARLKVPRESVFDEFSADTTMDYLLPSTTGNGIFTTALVDYLVQVHNTFVRKCHNIMLEQQRYVIPIVLVSYHVWIHKNY